MSCTKTAAPSPDGERGPSTFSSVNNDEKHVTNYLEGYDVSKVQCTKLLSAICEATKNDAGHIPSKLLDFIVQSSFGHKSSWSMAGCTAVEGCDWIVLELQKRVALGQYWIVLKVYSVIHELLWRGSQDFAASMEKHGMDMLNCNAVVQKLLETAQENTSGTALPCTIKAPDTRKKVCGGLFTCNKSTSPKPQAAPTTGPTCDGAVSARAHGTLDTKDASSCSAGFMDLSKKTDFLGPFLAYLEAFCQYRNHHSNIDLAHSRFHASPEASLVNVNDLKRLLDDTLELLKSTATSDPQVPVGCILAMTVVRKRMNDARVLYSIARLTLLKMLEYLFTQASLCMAIWSERHAKTGSVETEKTSADRKETDKRNPSEAKSPSLEALGGSLHATPSDAPSTRGVSEEDLQHKMIEFFAQWYHAIFQFDRTVEMLQAYCDEVEKNSGETYLVASHLYRIPQEALSGIRTLLKSARDASGRIRSSTLSECDLTSPKPDSSTPFSPPSTCILTESLCSDPSKSTEAHLEDMFSTWKLQLLALRQLFEMEGEAPPILSHLQASLDTFFKVKKEMMNSKSCQSSFLSNGPLTSSCLQSDRADSPLSLDTPMATATHTAGRDAATANLRLEEACNNGVFTEEDDDGESHQAKTSPCHTATADSSSDVHGTGTFVLRRRPGQQPSDLKHATTYVTLNSGGTRRKRDVDEDIEVIPLTEEMRRTDESIQHLLQSDDVVVVCNESFSGNDHMNLVERFQIISGLPPLGEGTYGRVFRAWDDLVGRYLAAKELPLDESKKRASAVREVLKEYMVLTDLEHPNIVRVVAFMVVGKIGRTFMEWMPSGSLQDVLRFSPRGVLRESVVSRYADDALRGLSYLHSRGVLHRDVKPGNMLLGSDGTVKLTDFGTSSVLAAGKHTLETAAITGTAPYMAPEAVQGLYSTASDIWSFGCSVLELVTGRVPWSDPVTGNKMDAIPLLFKIGSLSDTDSATINERPNSHLVPESKADEANELEGDTIVSDDLVDFLKKVFVVNRHKRPTAEELMEHPFITSNRASWAQRKSVFQA